MRLKNFEIAAIKEIVLHRDPEAEIYLFGSRVDDTQRGGDIDLLIMSQSLTFLDKRKIRLALYDALGEQKIDLLLAQDDSKAFVRMALEQGVKL